MKAMNKTYLNNQNHQNSPLNKSLSITKSKIISVSNPERNQYGTKANKNEIRNVHNQKYNLELFK